MGGDATGKDCRIPSYEYDGSVIMFDRYNVYKIIIYIIYVSKSQFILANIYMISFFDIP